ncbi:MAG: YbaK/EbsC family protein [Candidatus Pacearchaeota archaeon]
MDPKLKSYLSSNSVEYKEYLHKAVFTVEESTDLKKTIPGMHCKCLFLKDESNNFYLVALPAKKRLNISDLRKRLQAKKLQFATEIELFENLNLKPGSVSIFGMIYAKDKEVTLIIDNDIWSAESCGFHPNINTSTLVITHLDLERFYNSISNKKYVMFL